MGRGRSHSNCTHLEALHISHPSPLTSHPKKLTSHPKPPPFGRGYHSLIYGFTSKSNEYGTTLMF